MWAFFDLCANLAAMEQIEYGGNYEVRNSLVPYFECLLCFDNSNSPVGHIGPRPAGYRSNHPQLLFGDARPI